jgi:hypothetical protein
LVAGAAGVLATTGIGLAAAVDVVLAVVLVVADAFVSGAGAVVVVVEVLAVVPTDCVAVPLVADIALAGVIVVAEVCPALVVAGEQGAALAEFCATGAAGAAAFFLNSDPRLENAVVAFETAVLALAGT